MDRSCWTGRRSHVFSRRDLTQKSNSWSRSGEKRGVFQIYIYLKFTFNQILVTTADTAGCILWKIFVVRRSNREVWSTVRWRACKMARDVSWHSADYWDGVRCVWSETRFSSPHVYSDHGEQPDWLIGRATTSARLPRREPVNLASVGEARRLFFPSEEF